MQELIFMLGACGIMAILPAVIADYKGRDFGTWWCYGFLLFGVALIHVLCISKRSSKQCKHCAAYLLSDEASRCASCGGEQ